MNAVRISTENDKVLIVYFHNCLTTLTWDDIDEMWQWRAQITPSANRARRSYCL